MPRVSFSNDYLLGTSWRTLDSLTNCFDRYHQGPSLITKVPGDEQPSTLSPNEIDEILSRKLYNQLKTTSGIEKVEQNLKQKPDSSVNPSSTAGIIDPELIALIDRFFNLTYLNTIPMVNLLSTAIATNFLKENIRDLDRRLQEQQATHICPNINRGASLIYQSETNDDDDSLSWASAPT